MRFLKNKLRLAQEALKRKQLKSQSSPTISITSSLSQDSTPTVSSSLPPSLSLPQKKTITFTKPQKNIIINYGKAIFSFATSELAKPYIERHFAGENVDLAGFYNFLEGSRTRISGAKNFELLFVVEERDNAETGLYKRVLKVLGEIFVKYFSVNWIIHGKVAHKMIYLKQRYDILRRIQYGVEILA